jgi:(p)ppGpp synthase/HD superfamily hydrolase
MNKNLIQRAKNFSHIAHDSIGQRRKYTNEPYWTHTDAVAEIVAKFGGSDIQIAAAHLHDYREDVVPKLLADMRLDFLDKLEFEYSKFPKAVKELVVELTDVFTPEAYPHQNRAERHAAEAVRLTTISNEAKTIKLADMFHNTSSIVAEDEGFAKTYLKEKHHVIVGLNGMEGGNPALLKIVRKQLQESVDKLNIFV